MQEENDAPGARDKESDDPQRLLRGWRAHLIRTPVEGVEGYLDAVGDDYFFAYLMHWGTADAGYVTFPVVLDADVRHVVETQPLNPVRIWGRFTLDLGNQLVLHVHQIKRGRSPMPSSGAEEFESILKVEMPEIMVRHFATNPDEPRSQIPESIAITQHPTGEGDDPMADELRREMRTEIASLRTEMIDQRKELNTEITRTRIEILEALKGIQADFNVFRAEVRTDLDRLKDSDTSRRVEISDLRGDLKTLDSQFRNELTDIRGDLKVLTARITTATAVIVGVVTLVGTIIGILGAVGVFS